MPDEVKPTESAKAPEPPPQGSSPAEKAPATAPSVEAGAKASTDKQDKAVHGLKTDLFKARAKARDAEDTASKLSSRLEALEQSISRLSSAKE